MTNTIKNNLEITEEDLEELNDKIEENEFAFFLDAEGNLKTGILPGEADENDLPETVTKVTNTIKNNLDITEEDLEELNDTIEGNEFVFVLDSEGNLKTVILPGEADENDLPETVTKVLQVFELDDLNPQTLH